MVCCDRRIMIATLAIGITSLLLVDQIKTASKVTILSNLLESIDAPFMTRESLAQNYLSGARARGDENAAATVHNKPLNILILYPDDWRHDSLGSADPNKIVQTPFLDRMAQMGIRFSQNCVTTSICWISRATLVTGQYASRHHSIRLADPPFYNNFSNSFPALLREVGGYYTGHIGKWQFHDSFFVQRQYNYTHLFEGSHWMGGKHTTIITENSTVAFLRNRPKDVPFFLTAAFYAPKAVGDKEQFFPRTT